MDVWTILGEIWLKKMLYGASWEWPALYGQNDRSDRRDASDMWRGVGRVRGWL